MSEILAIACDMAHDLFKAGAMDGNTMRKIKELCPPGEANKMPK